MEFTCIECETLYDDTDGDTDERMCNKCLDRIYDESGVIDSLISLPALEAFQFVFPNLEILLL